MVGKTGLKDRFFKMFSFIYLYISCVFKIQNNIILLCHFSFTEPPI